MKDYRKLMVWEKAHRLVLEVYKLTCTYPREEQFNLLSQLRRAATSVPTNIVEGCGRFTQKDFAKFYKMLLDRHRRLNIYYSYHLS